MNEMSLRCLGCRKHYIIRQQLRQQQRQGERGGLLESPLIDI